MARSLTPIAHIDVITRPGASPQKILDFLKQRPGILPKYQIVIVHTGTTWLSAKNEWALYLKLVNSQIKKQEYNEILVSMNPPPAVGPAVVFRDNYTNLIGFIKGVNPKATILVSAIIPRPWDHERRHLVRVCYNNLLKKFNSPSDNVYFLPTYNPFFDKSKNLKQDLYNVDGIHLSVLGSIVLRSFFCEKLTKLKKVT